MPQNKIIKRVGIITKRNIEGKEKFIRKIVAYLKRKNLEIILDTNACKLFRKIEGCKKTQILSKADLVITMGGDGTLLKTARRVSRRKILVLGVNFGTLGFLTECKPDRTIDCLNKVFDKQFHVDKRSLLRTTIYRQGNKIATYLALNDAVINQGAFARLITMDLEVDNRKITKISADGLICSTPTGSTAHSLSAGGPIVHPKIQGLVISPICPSSLSMRPIVMPDNKQVTVTIETKRRDESAIIGLTLDGQDMMVLRYGDKIKFRRSSRNLYMIRTGNKYFKVLRQKLHWGDFN
ncbi:hypothetical protein GF354_01340 [Candidatus Peregrinibacteria bacterium]|nr:hypothetical protein [Candidatus Peregrinibacteria bacterium]